MSKSAAGGGLSASGRSNSGQDAVKIIGSFIWPEMRMIVNLFDVANKSYKTDTVGDIFTEQG